MNSPVNKKHEPIPEVGLRILRSRRQTMHYKDLVAEIATERGELPSGGPEHLAQVLTQINLDARFVHMGKGYWGLKDWAGGQQKPIPVVIPGEGEYLPKPEDYRLVDEEDDHDDESELLIPVADDEEEAFADEESDAQGSDDEENEDDE